MWHTTTERSEQNPKPLLLIFTGSKQESLRATIKVLLNVTFLRNQKGPSTHELSSTHKYNVYLTAYQSLMVHFSLWSKHCLNHEFVFTLFLGIIVKRLQHNWNLEPRRNLSTVTIEHRWSFVIIIQYCSKVSLQSLVSRKTWLWARFSTLANFENRALSWIRLLASWLFWVSSQEK